MTPGQLTALPTGTSDDLVSQLLTDLGDQVAAAVDVFEVAVLLEASGVSDRVARDRYGAVDVVDLAWTLVDAQPQAPAAERRSAPTDWYGSPLECLLKGMSFVFAGLMSVTVTEIVGHRHAGAVVLGSSVLATGLMGWLSHLGHTATQRVPREQQGAALASLLVSGLAAAVGVGLLVGGVTRAPVLGLLAAIPLLYGVSAVMVLVLGHHVFFGLALLPGGVLAVVHVVAPGPAVSARVVVIASAVGLLLILGRAVASALPFGRSGNGVDATDVRAALPFALSGLLLALLVASVLIVLRDVPAMRSASARQWFALALPLYVPLSLADVVVTTYRRRIVGTLATSMSPAELASTARRSAGRLWLLILAIGAGTTWLVLLLDPLRDETVAALICTSFFLLATVLVAALLADDGVAAVRRNLFVALTLAVSLLGLAGSFGPGGSSLRMVSALAVLLAAGAASFLVVLVRRSASLAAYRWVI